MQGQHLRIILLQPAFHSPNLPLNSETASYTLPKWLPWQIKVGSLTAIIESYNEIGRRKVALDVLISSTTFVAIGVSRHAYFYHSSALSIMMITLCMSEESLRRSKSSPTLSQGRDAYISTTVPGFPNLWTILGQFSIPWYQSFADVFPRTHTAGLVIYTDEVQISCIHSI